MAHIQQQGVRDHKHRLEDPEEPLIADQGRQRNEVHAGCVFCLGDREVLDGTERGADADEGGGEVEGQEDGVEVLGEDVAARAFAVEVRGEEDKEPENHELEDERCFEERSSNCAAGVVQ